MQEVTAQLRYLRQSPRKTRLVADLIRGRKVRRAQDLLSVLNKRAAKPVLKLLNSAVANAKNNFSLSDENLKVAHISVDGGPMLKRWMPKAHGRATPIRERTCHVKIVLRSLGEVKSQSKKSKNKAGENKDSSIS